MLETKVSADFEGGHPDDANGMTAPPLAGKTAEQVYRAHHGLDEQTGKLLPGSMGLIGDGCGCSHCVEHINAGGTPAPRANISILRAAAYVREDPAAAAAAAAQAALVKALEAKVAALETTIKENASVNAQILETLKNLQQPKV